MATLFIKEVKGVVEFIVSRLLVDSSTASF